jgi:hypothetical protein
MMPTIPHIGKSKGKRQKAKCKNKKLHSLFNDNSSFLPFAFCLLPFDFS